MKPGDDRRYARMAEAIAYLAARWDQPPGLAAAARASGLSPWHFQREFKRWVGVSPKHFQGFLTLGHAKASLKRDLPVLEAALAAGLSGPSRLHDLAVAFDAASPGEIRTGGGGLTLRHGVAETPFGRIFAVVSPRGIVRLAFVEPGGETRALAAERLAWPGARFAADDGAVRAIAARLISRRKPSGGSLGLAPLGTNFQIKVWQALLAIPRGAVVTYAMIAQAIGAARAIGGACAANPIAVLIPCHRVLRNSGALGGYAFGPDVKRALLAWEAATPGTARIPCHSVPDAMVSGQRPLSR
ncbi:MAG: methylated-DNA--[protein]-cysteine S-methyltransferase [Alphaproteobacteria bacterium]|nr:methylated-DNA--[protein]-cysteine S-methyltransferase [Alphaproteobacteria bacterium]